MQKLYTPNNIAMLHIDWVCLTLSHIMDFLEYLTFNNYDIIYKSLFWHIASFSDLYFGILPDLSFVFDCKSK